MEKLKKRLLQAEIEQDAHEIEKEIERRPELDQIQVTEEMDAALFARIRQYEKEKAEEDEIRKVLEEKRNEKASDMEAAEELVPDPERIFRKKPGKRGIRGIRRIAVFAAVLVLVLGLGMTSVGSKSYWKELLDVIMGKESARVIDVEDMDKKQTEDFDEVLIYQEIEKKLGQTPVQIRYKPAEMELEHYEIDEDMHLARLLFSCGDNTLRYSIYASQEDSSWTVKEEDEIVDTYKVEVNGIPIEVKELEKPNQTGSRMIAGFEYEGMHYELKGVLEKAEFDKILENLYFM